MEKNYGLDLISRDPGLLYKNYHFTMGHNGDCSDTKNYKAFIKMVFNDFDQSFKYILEDLKSDEDLNEVKYIQDRVKFVFESNIPHGKKNRGVMTILSFRAFTHNTDEEVVRKSQILGWCTEILQASCLIADDIMDSSETRLLLIWQTDLIPARAKRRGKICWYKQPEVGLLAVNDAFMLENFVYSLIRKHFDHSPKLINQFVKIFGDITLKTTFGQMMDSKLSNEKSFKNFNIGNYSKMVKYKTSYYTFYLPVMVGAVLGGKCETDEAMNSIKDILFEMGFYFQVQDDFLDCFGDVSVTGKIGTDIQEGKCTWLIVKALEKANDTQKGKLEENYWNRDSSTETTDSKNVENVKKMYEELDLKRDFEEFERKENKTIGKMIDNIPELEIRLFLHGVKSTIQNRNS